MSYHDSNFDDAFGWRNKPPTPVLDSEDSFNITNLLLICLICLLLYCFAKWYRQRPKSKRRKSYLRRFLNF